jgi:hypothetical protein
MAAIHTWWPQALLLTAACALIAVAFHADLRPLRDGVTRRGTSASAPALVPLTLSWMSLAVVVFGTALLTRRLLWVGGATVLATVALIAGQRVWPGAFTLHTRLFLSPVSLASAIALVLLCRVQLARHGQLGRWLRPLSCCS